MTDIREKITNIYLLGMLGIFPLFTGFWGYTKIAQSKWWFYVIATGLWVLSLLVASLKHHEPISFKALPVSGYLLIVLCLWAILSALVSPEGFSVCFLGAGTYDGLLSLLLYVLTAILIARFGRYSVWLPRVFGLSIFLSLTIGIFQLLDFNPLGLFPHGWRYSDAGILYSGLYLTTFGNTLILCSALSFGIPWFIFTAFQKRGWDWLLLLPAILGLFILLVCEGSSALVALFAVLLLALGFYTPKAKRWILWLIYGLGALGILAFLWFYPGSSGTLYEFSQLLHGKLSPEFGSHRIQIWQACLELFQERPLFGGGPGTLANRIHVEFSRYVPETGQTLSTYTTNAHNEYLGYLVNLGLPGFLLYITAMLTTLFRKKSFQRTWLPLTLSLIGYWIQSFFGLGYVLSAPLLWIGWGLVLGRKTDDI